MLRKIAEELEIDLSETTWMVDKQIVKKLGTDTAVLFAELLQRLDYPDRICIPMSSKEIEATTGIKRKRQERIKRVLVQEGLIKISKFGFPRVMHFTFDEDCLNRYQQLILNSAKE